MTNPHDALFRYTFSQPEHAAALIRSNLPSTLVEHVDWSSLQLKPGSFVDEELAWRHSDLVFEARVGGHDARLYVLVEHQSTADPLMAFRVLRYMTRLWSHVLAEDPARTTLPAVIPIVVHHGTSAWTVSCELRDLIELDAALVDALGEHLPRSRFVLDDLSHQSDAALRARALTQLGVLTCWCLENLPESRDPIGDFERILDVFAAVARAPRGLDALAAVLHYFMEVNDPEPDRLRTVLQARVGRHTTDTMITTAEKLRAEGRSQGREEGREEGRTQGRAEVILKLLALKFGSLPASAERRVRRASLEELDAIAERVLFAKTLAAALRSARKPR
ncbi:MAG TPA: Rpn family recombination-promoting nuclease/putative transposase [Polyangiales bacterium]|nr:Rpn family recombination-promoting nuclease/putative transposase [Polyangiales bacterium]